MSRKPADVASKEKNEYIPSFITKKPFWVPDDDSTSTTDYLEHQRLHKEASAADFSRWYDRGKKLGPAATKFRKGACENCGAITHKTKECLSRPRAKGARWTGRDIQADEAVQDVNLGWDAKRDRWNGYDASEYRQVVSEYNKLENLKRKAKGDEHRGEKPLEDCEEPAADEDAKYAEESDMGRQQNTATRNLRLREDTAKYLLNLDLDSAKYDPKTRTMIDMGAQLDEASALVAEDNFMRASGDAAEFDSAQRAAWESQQRGDKDKLHLQANPTAGEHLRKKEKAEFDAKREAHLKKLREKYGEPQQPPSSLRHAAITENEQYVEYDESGDVKGAPKVIAKSKYPEDVFVNNHSSVWGSWWSNFQWGYACCHSSVKNSYCTGVEGKNAFAEAERQRTGGNLVDEQRPPEPDATEVDVQVEADAAKTANAKSGALRPADAASKKRIAVEMTQGVTDEEMEAYKRTKAQADDPMARFLGNDELVH